MLEYEKSLGRGEKVVIIKGLKCERCGFVLLADDDAIWSAAGTR